MHEVGVIPKRGSWQAERKNQMRRLALTARLHGSALRLASAGIQIPRSFPETDSESAGSRIDTEEHTQNLKSSLLPANKAHM
jgi:hypothetical protein